MNSKNNYTEQLEHVIKQMLRPLKDIPLNLVIESLCDKKIIPFERSDSKDQQMLEKLKKVCAIAGSEVNRKGIIRSRPNEVGNDIEPFVKGALKLVGYQAYTPRTITGKSKATGYPDIEFIDEFGRANYLECKTYNIENISTTQRSFYLSPSEEFKITKDAHHLVVSFEIFVADTRERNYVFNCKSWKIISIENLLVDVKYEFNSDNRRLYAADLILAEGTI